MNGLNFAITSIIRGESPGRSRQFIYADEPQRDGADNGLVADWSRSGLSATEVMTQFATIINCYGFRWFAVRYAERFRGGGRRDETEAETPALCPGADAV